jgi:hypothetical protein
MAKRGRPKGTGKAFSTDPDRLVIGMVDGLLISSPGIKFEHAVMFSIYFHRREQIALPADPLQSVRRLGLSTRVQEQLRQGWQLQQWGPENPPNHDVIGGQVDRIRKKMARFANDPAAAGWRYYMGRAWASLLSTPNIWIIEAAVREADELAYFKTTMLPFAKNAAA